MNEADAIAWLERNAGVSRETMLALKTFVAFLNREAQSQNLVSASSLEQVWARHIVDSAQLLQYVDLSRPSVKWLDLGSGAGFPGLIVALLTNFHVTLAESRARRI
ncbi:RsmG family class I SAM-dependent methyltransferase, partial [Sphingorhabdus sp.]|uniref:RsmG family class I SAM-dependent methyltransferase n=1 Tax=Sphingorhabdus sp. TaxID=1902408 RepID=UPI00391AAB0D